MSEVPPPRQGRLLSGRYRALIATRLGIAVVGVAGTALLSIAGLGMLLAPHSFFRFVPDIELALIDHGRHAFGHDPVPVDLWTWMQFAYAALWGGLCFGAWWTLPAQNRRIDAALRA